MPVGSYSLRLTTRSAERSSGGSAARPAWPANAPGPTRRGSRRAWTAAETQVVAEAGARLAGHDQVRAGHLGHRAQQGGERVMLRQVGHGQQARPGGALGDRPLRGELVGVHAAGDNADRPAGYAEPGQVGLLVGAPGEHGARGAADRGLKADALGAGVTRDHVMPPLGDAQGVERLHNRDPQVTGGRQGGEAAGPAQRVHHVGAVAAQALVQRAAEGGNLREQVGLAVLPVRGADVLHRDTRRKRGSLGSPARAAARIRSPRDPYWPATGSAQPASCRLPARFRHWTGSLPAVLPGRSSWSLSSPHISIAASSRGAWRLQRKEKWPREHARR